MSGSAGEEAGTPSRPPRFLADENLESAIVEGVHRKRPGCVFLTVREAGTLHREDPDVLQRAKDLDFILVSHDRHTMYQHFATFLMHLPAGEHSPGVFLVSQEKHSLGQIINYLVEVYDLSSWAMSHLCGSDWTGRTGRLQGKWDVLR